MAIQPNVLFNKEFKTMLFDLKNMNCNNEIYTIHKIPVPQLDTLSLDIANGGIIKGVKEPYFIALNDKVVNIEKRQAWTKREYDQYGKILRDKDGNELKKDITIPMGSVVISTDVNIKLPNVDPNSAYRQKYVPHDGFKYIDFMSETITTSVPYYRTLSREQLQQIMQSTAENSMQQQMLNRPVQQMSKKKTFYYEIPKDYVYELNLCALVISKDSRRKTYDGYKIALTNGTSIYLYVLPFTGRQNTYRVLGLKTSPDFNSEITKIVQMWQQQGLSFDYDLCKLDNNNLGYTHIQGDCSISDYVAYDVSLANRGNEEF